MNDAKQQALDNIAQMLNQGGRVIPVSLYQAEDFRQLEGRLYRASRAFMNMAVTPHVLAQLSHSLVEDVEGFCDSHNWVGDRPKAYAVRCSEALDNFHIVLVPHLFNGECNYPCGCRMFFRDGRFLNIAGRPTPPPNRLRHG